MIGQPRKLWTDAETELARTNYNRAVSPEDFLRIVGRTKSDAQKRLAYLDHPEVSLKRREEEADRRAQLQALETRPPAPDRNAPPPEVIAEAVQRARVPRSLTAILCGDPAPGFSALERRA